MRTSEKQLSNKTNLAPFCNSVARILVEILLKALEFQNVLKGTSLKVSGRVKSKKRFSEKIMHKMFETNFKFHVK